MSELIDEPMWDELVPEVTLRPQQRDALHRIFQVFWGPDSKNIVFLQAPTGVGKSIIQLALTRFVFEQFKQRGFIVTPQKILQDQMKGWDGLAIMKGKGSYECKLMEGSNISARNAPCNLSAQVREDNPGSCSDNNCPFYRALSIAKEKESVMHNYASLMAQARISGHFGPRGILCLDEAHTAVNWIRNYFECTIEPGDLLTLTTDDPPQNAAHFLPWLKWQLRNIDWANDKPTGLSEEMSINLMKMFAHADGFGIMSEVELQKAYADSGTDKSYEGFAKRMLINTGLVPFHTRWVEPNPWKENGAWEIRPVKIAGMAGSLTGLGTKILVITATVLHKSLFAAELGMDLKDVEFIDIDSAFDPQNRPVRKMYAGSMSYKNKLRTYPKLIDNIERIASIHPDDAGLIHTHSHYLAKEITESLQMRISGRVIEQLPRGSARTDVIHQFLSGALGPNAILVGPSMMEGVDGADDSCRWQVMAKAPWPHMKDPTVEYFMSKLSKKWADAWYQWKAAQITVQGIGRVVRSADDYGTTYLLDSGFERILRSGYIPQYVIDAIE